MTLAMEVCEYVVITSASTFLIDPSYEVPSSSTFDNIVCEMDNTHVVACQLVSDDDSDQHGVIV